MMTVSNSLAFKARAKTVFQASCAVLLPIVAPSPCAGAQSLLFPTQPAWTLAPVQSPANESQKKSQSDTEKNSPKHIFWLVPAFNATYQTKFQLLTPRDKFNEWLDGTYDPRGLALYAFEAAPLEYSSSDGFCGYGKGWGGYVFAYW